MFWKKNQKPEKAAPNSPTAENLSEIDRELAELEAQPSRYHHYVLAHVALRSIAHSEPMMFFGALASEHKQRFLEDVLQSVDEQSDGEVLDFAASDIAVSHVSMANMPCMVLQFPSPRSTTEVHFVGAVLKHEFGTDMPEGHKPQVDYFTLEHGYQLDDQTPRTALCQWTPDGGHVNFGDGPAPELDAFCRRIRQFYD